MTGRRANGALMVCGTASDVGKSQLVAGLCRAFARRGVRVAPFKGQNMALNSVITPDGCEIARSQGTQALAAGVPPEAAMNPVLLKPTGDRRSQVVVLGRSWRDLDAVALQGAKAELAPVVDGALADLRRRFDVVVCEGAGSPAEINLFDHDLVNLGLAARAGLPAVVVGDIDRGGVFAHLYGTVALLPDDRRSCVRGFVVNKFRGEPALLAGAAEELRRRCGVPTLGVVPYLRDLWLDAEDSLALDGAPWAGAGGSPDGGERLDVAVVRLPHLANFTDMDPLAAEPGVGVRLVAHRAALGGPDVVVLGGSKSTVADLEWLRSSGLAAAVLDCQRAGTVVVGICAGYQMLGRSIEDPEGVEAAVPHADGLGLLDVRTRFRPDKRTARRRGRTRSDGSPSGHGAGSGGGSGGGGGYEVEGYEVHHGRPRAGEGARPWFDLGPWPSAGGAPGAAPPDPEDAAGPEGVADEAAGVYGTSLHGLFEADGFRAAFLAHVASRRGKARDPSGVSFAALRQAQIDRLADTCEIHLDIDALLALASEAG